MVYHVLLNILRSFAELLWPLWPFVFVFSFAYGLKSLWKGGDSRGKWELGLAGFALLMMFTLLIFFS